MPKKLLCPIQNNNVNERSIKQIGRRSIRALRFIRIESTRNSREKSSMQWFNAVNIVLAMGNDVDENVCYGISNDFTTLPSNQLPTSFKSPFVVQFHSFIRVDIPGMIFIWNNISDGTNVPPVTHSTFRIAGICKYRNVMRNVSKALKASQTEEPMREWKKKMKKKTWRKF